MLSDLMRERRHHPMEDAVWLLEFVSSTKGARHLLHSSRHMNLIQYFSIDVMAFLVMIGVAIINILLVAFCQVKKNLGKTKCD